MTAAWKYSLSPISYIRDIEDPFFWGCVISLVYRTVNLKAKLEIAEKTSSTNDHPRISCPFLWVSFLLEKKKPRCGYSNNVILNDYLRLNLTMFFSPLNPDFPPCISTPLDSKLLKMLLVSHSNCKYILT